MSHHWLASDPFLKKALVEDEASITSRLQAWNLLTTEFISTLDLWFANFEASDKELAYKVFLNIDYYNYNRFMQRLQALREAVMRAAIDNGIKMSSLILVTPEGGGDSAHRHAYDLVKTWNLPRGQVKSVKDLQELDLRSVCLVLFNDTYGSGTQFMNEVWPLVPKEALHIFLVSIALADTAYVRFKKLAGVRVFPDSHTPGARDLFSTREVDRLEKIGKRVYSKHPLGYGGAGLLTAFYFQCPNNSLPIIWSNGQNNNVGNAEPYPWSPLFVYKPKKKLVDSESSEPNSERKRLLMDIEELRRFIGR